MKKEVVSIAVFSMVLIPQLLSGRVVISNPNHWMLSSSRTSVKINIAGSDGEPAGSIVGLSHYDNGFIKGNDELFAVRAGDFYPAFGSATVLDTNRFVVTSTAFTTRDHRIINLTTTIDFTLTDNRLLIRYSIATIDSTEFPDGLEIISTSTNWDSIQCYNHTGAVYRIATSDTAQDLRWSVFPLVELRSASDRVWIISRNPYRGLWWLHHDLQAQQWSLKAQLLATLSGYTGPPTFSTLGRHYTMQFEYEIVIGTASDTILSALAGPLVYFSPFPKSYEQIMTMIFDEAPFEWPTPVGDPKTWNVATSGHDSTAPIGQYMVRLLEDHPRMKQGWLTLLDYIRDSTWIANRAESRWWRVQGKYRNFLNSTEAFQHWLQNIDDGTVVYGYEDRVHLGGHGLHHTPGDSFVDYTPGRIGWEFQFYDPAAHESTFARIDEIYRTIGWTNKPRFFRPPGFKRTTSLMSSLLRHGYKIVDIDASLRKPKVNPLVYPLFSPEHRMWLVSSTWAGDGPDDYTFMKNVLAQGEYVLTAGHPWAWFNDGKDSTKYEVQNQIFKTAERDFPHLGYLFPDEFGDFMDELYDIRNIASDAVSPAQSKQFGLIFGFDGSLGREETAVVEYDPLRYHLEGNIWVDGEELRSYECRGNRIYITFPHLPDGVHTVTVPLFPNTVHFPPKGSITCVPNPANTTTDILFSGTVTGTVEVIVYNILGQIVRHMPVGLKNGDKFIYRWDTSDDRGRLVPAGSYFIGVSGTTVHGTRKVIVVR